MYQELCKGSQAKLLFNTKPAFSGLVASGGITYCGITESEVQGWVTCHNYDISFVFAGRL